MKWEYSLFNRTKDIQSHYFSYDFGGGSPLSKCYVMAYLASFLKFKNYVEIGVYKGRSLFSVAQAFKDNEGKVYGIDPYVLLEAKEYDLEETLKKEVNSFLEGLDFDDMYNQVLLNKDVFELSNVVEIIRKTSTEAAPYFKDIKIDMLHIDGNHDFKNVQADINNYSPLVREGGIIVFDCINWDSVKACYDEYKKDYIVLFETDDFGILMKNHKNEKSLEKADYISKKLKNLYPRLLQIQNKTEERKPTVNVGVLAYNHEKYIVHCLNSIIVQKGNFNLNIIICEDKSTDRTAEIIESYIKNTVVGENVTFEFLKSTKNLGMVKNLKRLLKACSNSKYTALMDGDDCWHDEEKLQTHIDFMESHPECSLSFDEIILYFENENKYEFYNIQQTLKGDVLTTSDITKMMFIGNISCCFYYTKYLDQIPDEFFEMFVADWILNIVCSLFGDIGHIKKAMTVYRKHNQGIWTGLSDYNMKKSTMGLIDNYNKFLNYTYDEDLSEIRKQCAIKVDDKYLESYDLLVIDDVFPHPVSGFRYEEFKNYFQHINSMKVLTTGASVHLLGSKTIDELIIDFKRENPEIGGKLEKFSTVDNINCKLLYFVFLQNAAAFVDVAERRGIPFIFTLYPGGGFGIGSPSSDQKLRRVLSSYCFRKVIVTQQATYNYLIENNFCRPEQIQYIFGVVTPIDKFENAEYLNKKHYGINKKNLDICFVAHKYTAYGEDKGYDVFIEVAKQLIKIHNNIQFHVVGNFHEKIIDVSEIRDNIKFYGIQQPDWFNEFYKDKDIIISPNTPGMIFTGSFDGFPTASCIDAGICKTAIFCTDPLSLNNSYFKDNKEIVIINRTISEIIAKVNYYYNKPRQLKDICENGHKVIMELYGFNSQIAPRIGLLKGNIQ
ncbi:class I SAM-dependent methyltransferase [Clostridium sp. CS001]|uniref:class I SAM-dependent methyltransferase n=1 Tax=Clostridium sp. CS001 TaxID=2880648 RepID=UPI001CF142D5|nr:class I SAM-dependent methyltransferase [Clostridium sp. CS001]MCB2291685.1 class I SAM-dependent methyltransferase [Clostridium sp. CS001]